ncbi:hypothetical protein U1Q18_015725 [Sarracenia purpurea var. burkii]
MDDHPGTAADPVGPEANDEVQAHQHPPQGPPSPTGLEGPSIFTHGAYQALIDGVQQLRNGMTQIEEVQTLHIEYLWRMMEHMGIHPHLSLP